MRISTLASAGMLPTHRAATVGHYIVRGVQEEDSARIRHSAGLVDCLGENCMQEVPQ